MNISKFSCVILAILISIPSQLIAANESSTPNAGPLAFKTTSTGDLSFNTGVVKGTLAKDGLGEGLKSITFVEGNVAIDENHGLLCPYRFLTPQRRYGFGSWEWPRTGKVLSNGAAQLLWGSAPDRPFAFSIVYRWQSADTLDCTVFFAPQTNLNQFELFLGSYFDKFTIGKAYVQSASDGLPGLQEATSNKGEIQLFPGSQQVLPIINDGRWKFPPFPMNFAIKAPLASPLGMRTQPGSGVSVIFMSPPEDCFALSMWTKGWSQCGYYLSLFGKDMKPRQTEVAHARLVFGKNFTDSQTLEKYTAYLKDRQNNHDDALLTSSETAAMQQVFTAPPSEVNAVKPPAWLSSEMPKPDANGWIQLFDGKHLFGCTPLSADLEARKIDLQDGALRLDSTALRFNVNCSDVDIRARIKKVSGTSNIDIRWTKDANGWNGYANWFSGEDSFNAGKNQEKKWKGLINTHGPKKYDGFFEMEVTAIGDTLTLRADGQTIGSAQDNSIASGSFGILGAKGTTLVERLEVRILDKKP